MRRLKSPESPMPLSGVTYPRLSLRLNTKTVQDTFEGFGFFFLTDLNKKRIFFL